MAHPYAPSQGGLLCLPAQSQERGGETRRWAVTRGELDRAVEGQQPSSRTGVCPFVWGGTGWALPEPYKMTSSKLLACMFLTKLSEKGLHEGGMRAQRPLVGPALTAQHCAARLAFAREHQNWKARHWHPVLFTDESSSHLAPYRLKSLETPWWTLCCLSYQPAWPVWRWVSDGLGKHILAGRTNLHVLANGTLTAGRYRD